MLERLPVEADDPDLLMRALVAGDILYSAPAESRDDQFYRPLSDWDALMELAGEIGKVPVVGRMKESWKNWNTKQRLSTVHRFPR